MLYTTYGVQYKVIDPGSVSSSNLPWDVPSLASIYQVGMEINGFTNQNSIYMYFVDKFGPETVFFTGLPDSNDLSPALAQSSLRREK